MFRIVAYCENKRLADCLSALRGIASIPETPQEVINGALVNGKPQATNNGDVTELFKSWAKGYDVKEVRLIDVKSFLRTIGKSGGTATSVMKQLKAAKIVSTKARKEGHGLYYKVI